MKFSEIKNHLNNFEKISFQLPNGKFVPKHFHLTEVGLITKKFIDCGGTLREENVINFQLWEANDYDHELTSEKILNIINISEKKLSLADLEIEVEYQFNETIGKFNLDFNGLHFILVSKLTNCLATDKCGVPPEKLKVKIGEWKPKTVSCTPESGCC